MTTADPAQAAPAVPRRRMAGPPIVALVCSAGGLQALTTVLRPLPPGFPAAVIVLQHQSPDQPSYLAAILARNCALPVALARHGAALRAGTVAVVPPGKHALATVGNRLALISTDHAPPYRPSADLLLTSLALVAARRTIAVILSGGGSDGATGAVVLHDFGGTVIAADKASSAHPAMPEAAISRGNAVDYVLPTGDIPALLVSLTRKQGVSGTGGRLVLRTKRTAPRAQSRPCARAARSPHRYRQART